MKSDHRHELKTNELAEWLGNLPQWTKENLTTIVLVAILIAAVAAFYIWKVYSKNVLQVREQTQFTNLLNQLSGSRMQVLEAQAQGRDLSFLLLQPAKRLETFAQSTNNDRMAALALIKRADALRAELHYGTVDEQYLISQTNLAKASYTEALEKSSTDPSLAAAAKFGLGLCAEELGNFEQARQIYQDIAANPDFECTVAVVQAKRRLETMADYEQKVVFRPAPKPPIQIKPVGASLPADVNLPPGLSLPAEANLAAEVNLVDEANLPVDGNLTPPTPDDTSVQVIPLPNKDVLALSAEDVTQMFERAGFSHSDLFEHITEVRDALAKSGAVQIKIHNTMEAVFAVRDDSVYISTRKKGNFIYNLNTADNIPQATDANLPADN